MTYSILIYDQVELIRSSLEIIISKEHKNATVFVTNSVEELKNLSKIICFDLIIMDIGYEGVEEICLIKKMKYNLPEVKVLIYSFNENNDFIDICFAKGANGVLSKNRDVNSLFIAINLLLKGENYFTKSEKVKSEKQEKVCKFKKSIIERLSTRELEVAKMLVKGFNNTEIKDKLNLTNSTISTFKKRVLLKTNANNVIELSRLFQNI